MPKTLIEKLSILADAAKYDASCASSGTSRRHSTRDSGLGSTEGMGICHAYAPDGRCISLLKILLTNFCIFDCRYCVNRSSSNVERARFTTDEVVRLVIDFYKRNYIEGLFLSSGIIRSPNYTMEQMVEVARALREDHDFRGYIHLKTIAEADPELIQTAGRYADRLSVNVELPKEESLKTLAPEKSGATIRKAMADVRFGIETAKPDRGRGIIAKAPPPTFAPAGQSTQMIVGADGASDRTILETSAKLYAGYRLKRVYYSAFSPIPDASKQLPPRAPVLMREHRLYQADWMCRFYGFDVSEIVSSQRDGMLDLKIDPKLAWAIANRSMFPVDVNRAPKRDLLRVPGLGPSSVTRILAARRNGRLRLDGLGKIVRSLKPVLPFVMAADYTPGSLTDTANLYARFAPAPVQPDLFA